MVKEDVSQLKETAAIIEGRLVRLEKREGLIKT